MHFQNKQLHRAQKQAEKSFRWFNCKRVVAVAKLQVEERERIACRSKTNKRIISAAGIARSLWVTRQFLFFLLQMLNQLTDATKRDSTTLRTPQPASHAFTQIHATWRLTRCSVPQNYYSSTDRSAENATRAVSWEKRTKRDGLTPRAKPPQGPLKNKNTLHYWYYSIDSPWKTKNR